jgi:inner membrane protein
MDSITQIALGAVIGQAIGYKKFGNKAAVFGGLGGLIPDLDVLATPFLGEYGSWKYHRHATHSLWFGPLLGSFMGWGLWKHYGRQAGHLMPWMWIMVLAILTHPLLDLFTIYGTQLLAPFSNQRFEISGVSIIDPIYTIILFLSLLLPVIKKWRHVVPATACIALFLTTSYLFFGWHLNTRAETYAAAQLAKQNIKTERMTAYTTIFQPFLRRVVVRDNADKIRVGFVSTFAPATIKWTCEAQAPKGLRDAILAGKDGKTLDWFALGETNIIMADGGKSAYMTDARYGLPGPSVFGWWGLEFAFSINDDGQYTVMPRGRTGIERNASWDAVKNLFYAAYGLPNTLMPEQDEDC